MELERSESNTIRNNITLKDSLKTKLILLTTSFIIITALSLTYLYSESSDKLILQQQSKLKLLQEKLQSAEMFNGIGSAQRDIHVLLKSPTLLTLLHLLKNSPTSPTTLEWKNRLTRTFVSYMDSSPDYMQMRLIGVQNGGKEIVRVDRTNDAIMDIPERRLQNKKDRDYYQDIIRLHRGEFYTSEINLNREFGKISEPYTPTIRIASPLFIGKDTLFAILIINIDLTHAFNAIKKLVEPDTTLFIVNGKGDYLVHPDKSKEFAFDFGRQERLQYDYPSLSADINNMGSNGLNEEVNLNGEEHFVHAIRLADGSELGPNKMFAIQLIPSEILFKEIDKTTDTGHIFAAIFTLLSILIALVFSQGILSPIHFLINAAISASNGKYTQADFPEGRDEIGLLSRSFREMVNRVKHRESVIRDNQARYKAIFSGADDGIVIVDKDGNIEEANDSFCQMIGVDPKDVNKHNLMELVSDRYSTVDCIGTQCRNCKIKQLCMGEAKLITHDGIFIPIYASLNGFESPLGERFATYIHDLRPQKASEDERMNLLMQLKQAQKMESVGLLASGIAHDFNNVLSCISGYSELMQINDNVDAKSRNEYLDQIIGAADKAKEMIRNLMLFSRTDTGTPHTEDVQKAIMEIISVLEHALTSRIILTHNIDITDTAVDVAPFQLQQIILNLCINARDAMDGDGSIHIEAHTTYTSPTVCSSCGNTFSGEYMELTVKDQGPGIEPEKLEKMFEPFFTTKAEGKGTGLGLYMVHSIVHETRGHILVETKPGEGAGFTLYLPIAERLSDNNTKDTHFYKSSVA